MEGRDSKPFLGWSPEAVRAPHHLVAGVVVFDGVIYATHFKEAVAMVVQPARHVPAGSNVFDAYFHMGTGPFMGMALLVALFVYHSVVFRDSFSFARRVRRHQLSLRFVPAESVPEIEEKLVAQEGREGPAGHQQSHAYTMTAQPFVSTVSSQRLSYLTSFSTGADNDATMVITRLRGSVSNSKPTRPH